MPPEAARAGRRPSRRRGLAALVVVGSLAAGCVAVCSAAWLATASGASLEARVAARLQTSGTRPVRLEQVAPIMRQAVVVSEDERFYRHQGIDLVGVLRALPYDLAHLSLAQGASTITEQVAKLLYLNGNDHTPWRKLEDAALALKLERRYTKEQILAAYLNSVYFGEGAYGIGAASERFFGVGPATLDLAQASLLAGLIQAPSAYDPRRDPQLARLRQVEVLRALVRAGVATQEDGGRALARPLRLRGGAALPPLRGIDLGPGPAFIWWELALGSAVMIAAGTALVVSRLPRFRLAHGVVAIRLFSLTVAILAAAAAVRSFRSA